MQGDTLFVYGRSGELLAELLPGGSVTQEYVYLDGAPIALLGPPASPAAPVVIDQIIDNNEGHPTHCSTERSRHAVNGDYQACTLVGYAYTLRWPWLPPVSGVYDILARWAWSSGDQCYGIGDDLECAGADASAGTWVSLGRHHLSAGIHDPVLDSVDHRYFDLDSLNMDAVRYVLHQADLTDRDYHYIHTDALGTPQRVTGKTGLVVWAAAYDPFGTASVDNDPDGDGTLLTLNLRFPGQYYDAETGLHYNYFRDYDPGLGRYVQSDPIGLWGGLNTYAYVGGNPVNAVELSPIPRTG